MTSVNGQSTLLRVQQLSGPGLCPGGLRQQLGPGGCGRSRPRWSPLPPLRAAARPLARRLPAPRDAAAWHPQPTGHWGCRDSRPWPRWPPPGQHPASGPRETAPVGEESGRQHLGPRRQRHGVPADEQSLLVGSAAPCATACSRQRPSPPGRLPPRSRSRQPKISRNGPRRATESTRSAVGPTPSRAPDPDGVGTELRAVSRLGQRGGALALAPGNQSLRPPRRWPRERDAQYGQLARTPRVDDGTWPIGESRFYSRKDGPHHSLHGPGQGTKGLCGFFPGRVTTNFTSLSW